MGVINGLQKSLPTLTCKMFKVFLFLGLIGGSLCGVPSCTTVFDEKCWDEPSQQCKYVQKPFTTTHYEQECVNKQVPKVDRVPEQKCIRVPEEKCHTEYEQECTTRYENKCHNEYKQKCHTENEKVCKTISETKVDYVTKQKCGLETEEQCHDVPEKKCHTVQKPVQKYRE